MKKPQGKTKEVFVILLESCRCIESAIEGLEAADLVRIAVETARSPIEVLAGLSLEGWSRSAIIKGRKEPEFSQARRMARHKQGHRGPFRGEGA